MRRVLIIHDDPIPRHGGLSYDDVVLLDFVMEEGRELRYLKIKVITTVSLEQISSRLKPWFHVHL